MPQEDFQSFKLRRITFIYVLHKYEIFRKLKYHADIHLGY